MHSQKLSLAMQIGIFDNKINEYAYLSITFS